MVNNLHYLRVVFTLSFLFSSFFSNSQTCPTAACVPPGPQFNAFGGIFNVSFGTINNSSQGAIVDGPYSDFSCTVQTQLTENGSYPISITTNNVFSESLIVLIDFNDDGFFTLPSEQVFSSTQLGNHSGTISIPSTAVKGVPLRMRISSENGFGPAPSICTNSFDSEIEDYGIIVMADTAPPVANFTASSTTICGGGANFTNSSTSSQAMSYLWDFGDGNTDTIEDPTHIYTNTGTFTVTLITTTVYGSDTLVRPNYITNNASTLTTASCIPNTATNAGLGFNSGIFNFTLNTINNSTGGDIDGYVDYSCTEHTNLIAGTPYPVSITTGSTVNERVKIWIDLDNDGTFTSSELLYTSGVGKVHNGTITIPSSAVTGVNLRLRVAADFFGSTSPTACSTPEYSQTEDYSVSISINTNPPIADFSASNVVICDGTASFSDLSINAPSSWRWYFGDGDSSTMQNPSHTYFSTGVYTITLITTNAIGSDTMVKNNYITFHDTIPTAACTPFTNNYCCGYGIFNVSFASINNNSGNAQVGYEDFTCTVRTRVTEGVSYPLSVTTSTTNNQTTKMWIDLDNSGTFEDSTELLFTSVGTMNPSGNIIIPSNVVFDTPLRMRVISDYTASSFDACFNITNGQAEDYTIIIEPNTVLPISNFTAVDTVSCDSIFSFTNLALNSPDTYLWDFGDGNTSTDPNPTHNYSNPGTYTITLIVTNAIGSDTLVKTNYITFTNSPEINCFPTTVAYCCNSGISRTLIGGINNFSADGSVGYENFACDYITTLKAGKSTPILVQTGNQISEHVVIWIDLNDDGVFTDSTEKVYYDLGLQFHYDSIRIPELAVYNKELRMRITSDRSTSMVPTPCANVFTGQHEDYSVIISEPDSTTTPPDGISKQLSSSEVNLYPIPATNFVNLKTNLSVISYNIVNQVGQLLIQKTYDQSNIINLESLPNGLYFITIKTKEGIVNKKIIVDGK